MNERDDEQGILEDRRAGGACGFVGSVWRAERGCGETVEYYPYYDGRPFVADAERVRACVGEGGAYAEPGQVGGGGDAVPAGFCGELAVYAEPCLPDDGAVQPPERAAAAGGGHRHDEGFFLGVVAGARV